MNDDLKRTWVFSDPMGVEMVVWGLAGDPPSIERVWVGGIEVKDLDFIRDDVVALIQGGMN